MTSAEKQERLNELWGEIEALKAFIAAVERGDHDDENVINPQIREIRRMSLQKQAYDRMNKEIYPEIHQLNFELKMGL